MHTPLKALWSDNTRKPVPIHNRATFARIRHLQSWLLLALLSLALAGLAEFILHAHARGKLLVLKHGRHIRFASNIRYFVQRRQSTHLLLVPRRLVSFIINAKRSYGGSFACFELTLIFYWGIYAACSSFKFWHEDVLLFARGVASMFKKCLLGRFAYVLWDKSSRVAA